MAFIPPNFNIVIKKKFSHNNCSTFNKENEYFYTCQDLDVTNFKQCCNLSIKNFMGDFQNNMCYQNNNTYFKITCSRDLEDDSYFKTALIILVSGLILLIIIFMTSICLKKKKFIQKEYETIN